MMRDSFRRFCNARLAALIATSVLHAWLLLIWQTRSDAPSPPLYEQRSQWIVLKPDIAPAPETPTQAVPRREPDTPRPIAVPAESEAPPVTAQEPAVAPNIDWHAEAELSAKALAEELYAPPSQRSLDSKPGNGREARGPKTKSDFDWRPETKRYGLTPQGLPYIQLGERCIYVTFIVVCAIGKLPPPNRNLFEHMGDPEQVESSVPDVEP